MRKRNSVLKPQPRKLSKCIVFFTSFKNFPFIEDTFSYSYVKIKSKNWNERVQMGSVETEAWTPASFSRHFTHKHIPAVECVHSCWNFRKLFQTTCLSPKAIIGDKACFWHLNPSALKKRECLLSCQLLWHKSNTFCRADTWMMIRAIHRLGEMSPQETAPVKINNPVALILQLMLPAWQTSKFKII